MRANIRVVSSFLCFCAFSTAQADEKITALPTFGDKTTVSVLVDSRNAAPSSDPVSGARAFIARHASSLKITAPAENLAVKTVDTDSLRTSHVRYRQEHRGIPVWGSELIVHLDKEGKVTSATGAVSGLGSVDTMPRLSQSEAIAQARGRWISEFGEDDGNLKSARLFVVDQILIDRNLGTKLHLAWEVRLVSSKASRSFKYLIDAHDGDVIGKFSLIKNLNRAVFDCSAGSPNAFGDGRCLLNFTTFSYIFGRSEGQPDRGANPLYSSDQFDTDFIYYRVGASHNYFLTQHGRDGANFVGGIGVSNLTSAFTPAASYAEEGTNHDQFSISFCPNANWDPDRERFSFCKGMPTLDIVGHEYTHAIEHFSVRDEFGAPSGLNFQNEAGALAEGFSDVFGEAIERFAYGSNDWMMGSSQGVTTPIMRNISNPESMNLPSTLYSPSYVCGTDDNGGIHSNNVVLAHAAYRLANGGELSGCTISGIGPGKQEAIFYRAVSTYLSPSSNFAGAYTALVNSCTDIFGADSQDCLQTKRTLNAVMMNQPGRCSGTPQAPVDCLDPSDLCPTNPNKRAPGACGCADEVDVDANGTLDCQSAAEFKADLTVFYKQIGKLTSNPKNKRKAGEKAARTEINRLFAELGNAVAAFGGQIPLTSTTANLNKLFSAVKKSTKVALKSSSRSLANDKSKAKKSTSKLLKVLA